RELQDVFTEIGLDDAYAGSLQRMVQADLLGDHRLRLRRELGTRARTRAGDVCGRLFGRPREERLPATILNRLPEPLDVRVEVVDDAHPRVVRALSQLLDVGLRIPRRDPIGPEPVRGEI